ncbi:MAG: DUF2237 domain-containing protein [Saprospiraceae bacterium]|nr:DUF2237 domain-containing protein [Saprospiraceae bacterium]HMW40723.1 DUF2237 domain-containing protein [Saprospiraceae bacterium]HMX89186.1 DUF2237 domain-containing protein [Saprospiraceae bacterium]HMZ40595.1 DUF2237 domain-containing protein [Saprospiraceae bacterium]HNA65755.1 DUF2237 domain-containing protein [Saprospiraceae bacterium]
MESSPLNVFNKPIEPCSMQPLTGFYRDGCCRTGEEDLGQHWVCIVATQEFLEFSASVGNDLSRPRPEYRFEGVKPGDRWCLCASRWIEAYHAGKAPLIVLEATNRNILNLVDFSLLLDFKYTAS